MRSVISRRIPGIIRIRIGVRRVGVRVGIRTIEEWSEAPPREEPVAMEVAMMEVAIMKMSAMKTTVVKTTVVKTMRSHHAAVKPTAHHAAVEPAAHHAAVEPAAHHAAVETPATTHLRRSRCDNQ